MRNVRDVQCGIIRAGKIFATVQYHSCQTNMPEGMLFCECGFYLCPKEDIINKIKARFQALIALNYPARVNRSRGKRHGDQPMARKKIIGKLWMSSEVRKKNNHSSILDRWHNNERYKKIRGSNRME